MVANISRPQLVWHSLYCPNRTIVGWVPKMAQSQSRLAGYSLNVNQQAGIVHFLKL
jgi:hypothetical protein